MLAYQFYPLKLNMTMLAGCPAPAVCSATISWLSEDVLVEHSLLRRSGRTAAGEIHRVAPPTTSLSMSAAALIGRQALHDTIACQHAPIDREVAANHEGSHGRILLGQSIRLVRKIRLIFSPIDEDETGEARGTSVCFVQWITPTSTPTETCVPC